MAGDPIGRADYELRAPIDALKKDLAAAKGEITAQGNATEAEFAKRSSKWGPALAAGAKAGIKVVGAVATGVLAIASKGALELQNHMADFQAATGASAEEAKRAGKAINEMSGRNIQGLDEITDTLTKVHTDLGLTGDAAEKTTERFLKFGRATKQDAGAAVLAFDDILDAWNLTADDSQAIMDKLIVSHQKYGGSIQANEKALASLAPAMQAANLTYDDGIGLLNLFAASGLDASDASGALTKALAKVKSPEELQRLIDDITATEDPFLRAQKAADLFGTKAGAKLANALAPGKGALKDYKVSAEDAAGATQKASDVLDGTFGTKIQLKIKEVSALVRGIGDDWGPALTGAAALGSAFSTIFGPEFIKKLAEAGKKGGEALIDGAATATGAAGTIIGNNISTRIEAIFDPTKNTIIGKAVRSAGAKVAAMYLAAQTFGAVLQSRLAAAWEATGASGLVTKAAALAGGKVGLAFAAGVALVPVVVLGALAFEFQKGQAEGEQAAVAAAVSDIITKGAVTGMLDARAELVKRLKQAEKFDLFGLDLNGTRKSIQAKIDAIDAAIGSSAPQLRDSWRSEMEKVGATTGPAIASGVEQSAPVVARRFHDTIHVLTNAAKKQLAHENRLAGLMASESLAQGILAARQKPVDAFNTLKDMLKHPLTKLKEQTRLLGELTSKDLQRGLHSKDPAIRDQAKATKAYIIDRLEELKTGSGKLTKEQARLVEKGLKSKDKDIKAAARAIKSYVQTPLQQLKDSGYSYGVGFTKGFIRGLVADIDRVRANARAISGVVKKYLQVRSPSELGPFSEMGGPEGWSKHWMTLYTKGLSSGIPKINGILGGLAGMSAPALGSANAAMGSQGVGGSVPPMLAGGSLSIGAIHIHGVGSDVSPAAATSFGRQILAETARGFREGSARRGFTTTVRP